MMKTEEMKEAIVGDMATWDSETILGWAQQERRLQLEQDTIEDVEREYHELFDDMEGAG